jgi:hypothetical protein
MNNNSQPPSNLLPELDLDLIRSDLEILAKETVDKTLAQAKAARTDPVLGSSSALATFYCRYAVTRETFSLNYPLWDEGDVHEQRSARDKTQITYTPACR